MLFSPMKTSASVFDNEESANKFITKIGKADELEIEYIK